MKNYFHVKISLSLLVALLFPLSLYANGARPSGKPRPPVQVSIVSAQPGLLSEEIKPGDTVALIVTVTSQTDAADMRVKVELTGGAELVAGDTSWNGAMAKNESKTFYLTVRAPAKGNAKVMAHVVIHISEDSSFAASASYSLGREMKKEEKPESELKKDSHGRDVNEFRVK